MSNSRPSRCAVPQIRRSDRFLLNVSIHVEDESTEARDLLKIENVAPEPDRATISLLARFRPAGKNPVVRASSVVAVNQTFPSPAGPGVIPNGALEGGAMGNAVMTPAV